MQHTFFVVLDSADVAQSVIEELEHVGTERRHCSVVMHRGTLEAEELQEGETAVRAGGVLGAVAAGTLGALFGGFIAGPAGLVGGGTLATMLLLGAEGAVFGGIFGAIAGSASPDQHLERMARELESGKVLLTVQSPDLTCAERAEQCLERRGIKIQRPSLA